MSSPTGSPASAHQQTEPVRQAARDPLRHGPAPKEMETLHEVDAHLSEYGDLTGVILVGVDLEPIRDRVLGCSLDGAVLIGCDAAPDVVVHATRSGAAVFPSFGALPYEPYRQTLYGADDLYDLFDPDRPLSYEDTLDARVYRHWLANGGAGGGGMMESLARRIHDHSITMAIEDLIADRDVVAVMGGHGLARTDPGYAAVARMSRALARHGRLMASGGGPGAMEATHVGAWMAPHADGAMDDALSILSAAPSYTPAGPWLAAAFAVMAAHPLPADATPSLGIPTWLYGHEPPNPFATHIAKYFANAVREDGLLTIARHGVVFTPGSAGTVQEVFQDATQNHYETVGPPSPMVFFGVDFWTNELPVMDVIERLGVDRRWLDEVHLTDDEAEVVHILANHVRDTRI